MCENMVVEEDIEPLSGLEDFEMDSILKTLEREERRIKIRLETRKWGREVTVIEGLDEKDGPSITKKLKSSLACGGTYKSGRAELQGDHRYKVREILVKMGYPIENIIIE